MGILDDQVILVAGCGGIGDELVRHYRTEGAKVVAGDIRADHAIDLARSIDPPGEHVVGVRLDGADNASVAEAVALALTSFGKLSGLHANFIGAGPKDDYLEGVTLEEFDDLMHVNAGGYLLCTQHVLQPMLDNGGGSILYTATSDTYLGASERLVYAMSKIANHALMRHVARRFGKHGIRANVVQPGLMLHPRVEEAMDERARERVRRSMALKGRLGRPSDIANTGAFLLSDRAEFITGQVVTVNGGLTMSP